MPFRWVLVISVKLFYEVFLAWGRRITFILQQLVLLWRRVIVVVDLYMGVEDVLFISDETLGY